MKTDSKHIKEITKHLRTWIEIDTAAIDSNLALARSLLPQDAQVMAVVKSNAYGHGLFDFAKYVTEHSGGSVNSIGVDSITEAIALRKDGIAVPILVMGYSLAERFAEAVEHDISITISSMSSLQDAIVFASSNAASGRSALKIHIKIDTGLHRQGFLPHEVSALIDVLKKRPESLRVEGLYTHLADAKRKEGIEYTRKQKQLFDDVRSQFSAAGFDVITHIVASPALLRFGKEFFGENNKAGKKSLVRLGALLYGIYPSDDMRNEFPEFQLRGALTWKTIISEIKQIPAGSSVGYNRSEIMSRDTVLAVCPIGYWHGYPGALSSQGTVLVHCGSATNGGNGTSQHPAKVLGRVSMDILTIDCTDCPGVKVGDEVMLVSADSESLVSAQKVAQKAGVSVHELLTRLNPKIKRIFL